MHRVCPRCYLECYDDADNAGDPPDDSNKRKAGNGESAALKKKRQSTGSSRVRLTLEQKGQVLDLVAQKVKYSNIAKKFGCAEKTVKNFVHDQDRIRKQLEEAGSSSGLVNAKASRRPQHPEVRLCGVLNYKLVMGCRVLLACYSPVG